MLPDIAPPASVADFTNIPGGSAMRLTERDVLVLENPTQVEVAPDLLHLVASAFAQVLRTARHGERRLAAEREAAMGRAIAQVAHDFKGHIFSLLGFSEMLESSDDAERGQITRRIGEVTRGMKSYVDDLLEYADSRRGLRKSRVNLMDLARHASEGNHACEVQVRGPAELPATVDAIKLERALRNLVSNAVDKAPDEGKDYRVTITVEESSGAAQITVEDNGRPVDPAVREALFEPLVSHGKPAGTGLGLAIAYEFVHRHGGELTLEETRQGCNRFKIHIPHAIETAAA
jgi:signal transduction histidine kinase